MTTLTVHIKLNLKRKANKGLMGKNYYSYFWLGKKISKKRYEELRNLANTDNQAEEEFRKELGYGKKNRMKFANGVYDAETETFKEYERMCIKCNMRRTDTYLCDKCFVGCASEFWNSNVPENPLSPKKWVDVDLVDDNLKTMDKYADTVLSIAPYTQREHTERELNNVGTGLHKITSFFRGLFGRKPDQDPLDIV